METKKAKINGLQSKLYGRLLPPSFRLSLARSQLSFDSIDGRERRDCAWTCGRAVGCYGACIVSALLAT